MSEIEAKRETEGGSEVGEGTAEGLEKKESGDWVPWADSRSSEELDAEIGEVSRRRAKGEAEAVACAVCGGKAEVRLGGFRRQSVFCGCWRSMTCAGRSVLMGGGDIEGAVKEWNRRNTGVLIWLAKKMMAFDEWLAEKKQERYERRAARGLRKIEKKRKGKGEGKSEEKGS